MEVKIDYPCKVPHQTNPFHTMSPDTKIVIYKEKENKTEYLCEKGCIHEVLHDNSRIDNFTRSENCLNKSIDAESQCNSCTSYYPPKTLLEDILPKKIPVSIKASSLLPTKLSQMQQEIKTRSSLRGEPKSNLYKKSSKTTRRNQKDEDKQATPEIILMDWKNYHRLEVIHKFMDDLEYSFPSLCSVGVIGQSLEGRNIKLLKISNSDARNASVWIDAGIHAREWIGPAVNTYVANHIARNFNSLPTFITNKDWYFLPVFNPDGYEYTHTTDRMWRKNRAYHAGRCVGVDLNRNFSYGWGGKGSSDNPTHCFYRGPGPFSEPESLAVKKMISNSGISFKVYVTLHSYGEVIIFPFASRDDLCPDYIRLLKGAAVMSKAIYETFGNTYKVGISKDVMYRASGTSNDWSYGEVGIPYCYLIELRSKKHKFKLPQEEIEETGNEILNCVKALMEFVDKYPLETTVVNE